ncbi:ABC-2 type transport system ATP-binding protein [Pedobacter psychrotolerans]|uniref:ABC-2 type transport system ATP-binding protein n=1 Tax=Pedobacter psychrotolerans TaxID=1843235 RepID=A0A4R2H871_9SPHI|nr:ATP-binding cassette domain-containing protein [Pedobacter psychrotolerans]TCO20615.1 ABC-2 type transport system ATP-binding protein [Pedobacter psychrotolerans]GGE66827.1 gliding motility-associated ABC transporter ATP-binding subunit GldA [Pedobacter psychrotolerans]
MSISVKNLSKHYDQQKAVDSISFEALPGRILGFLGPNGAGKSTTMRMLTGYLMPTSGIAEVSNQNIISQSIEAKKHIGYLPENTPLYTEMYVKEFLSFVGETYKLNNIASRVDEVIKLVGLTPEQHKKISMLSKGYRQRVGLAQAIIHNPDVLILDEPTSGLDPNQLVDIRALIKELGKNKTVIISTHIMQEVEAICDDIIIINKGKIVANDSLEGIKKAYHQDSLEEIFRKLTA